MIGKTVLRVFVLGMAAILFSLQGFGRQAARADEARGTASKGMSEAMRKDWLARWEKNILADERNRYCDKEMGEEIGWLVSPFTNGFYYGYLATHDTRWIDRLIDWSDAWIKRGIKEPDGYIGWPKDDGASASAVPGLYTDNLLGEAMGLRPAVLMADTILKAPALKAKYGEKAREYLRLSEQTFEKWDKRGCWREVQNGGVWIVPVFGIDKQTGQWTEGYARRNTDGFTLPANKQNFIALWLLAMYDATKKPVYRERAAKWFQVMKSRMRLREASKTYEWNYWDPAGPWDYKPDGTTKHWVGVHPNGGYYSIDAEGIVAAYEHHLVFTRRELDRLIATNRDFMWNHQVEGAKFQRIDGGEPDERWKNAPGVLWDALVPYDASLRKVFEANHNPASWGGLAATPWYIAQEAGRLSAGTE
ncbi:MAG TPA: hypothetical protein VFB21_11985 [Chthonomonadaceae bacterium]|nr:hypothetical protein [Chthonomonadaceae bacterium]